MSQRRAVLPAKLIAPNFTGLLPRSRLFRMIDQRTNRSVLWVTGLPGSGKSALVSSYLRACRLKGLWYRIDSGDRDPAGFFYYLGLAVNQAAPRMSTPLPLLTPEYRGDVAAFCQSYFRSLFPRIEPPFFLVFDDCHLLTEKDSFFELIKIGIAEALPGFCLIFISRNEPPSAFSSFMVDRSMQIVNQEELRLSEEEAVSVARCLFPSIPPEKARALHKQVEGWMAGLILLAEDSVSSGRSITDVRSGISPRTFDYFAGEIFDRMEPSIQDFLMQTSFLPGVSAKKAEALVKQPAAAAILSDLYRRRYFVERQADLPGSYRYHDLFRDFLRIEAERKYSPEQLRSIRMRAADLLAGEENPEEAIALYREAREWPAAVALIESSAESMIAQGRSQTVEGWIKGLPEEMFCRRPWLSYWLGVCRQPFDLTESREYFVQAFQHFSTADHTGRLLAWAGIVNSIWLALDEMGRLDPWIDWLEEHEARFPSYPSPLVEAQVVAAMINALSFRRPEHPLHDRWVDRALLLAAQISDLNLKIAIWFSVGYFWIWRGELNRLRGLIEQMAAAAELPNASPLLILTWKIVDAGFHWLGISAERGQAIAREALAIAKRYGVHLHDAWFYGVIIFTSLPKGDLQTAAETLKEMRRHCESAGRFNRAFLNYLAGWYAILEGDHNGAAAHAEAALQLAEEAGLPSYVGVFHVAMAHVRMEERDEDAARFHLDRADEIGRRIRSPIINLNRGLLAAHWAIRQGDAEKGVQLLRSALREGRGKEALGMLWCRPRILTPLCVKALEAKIEVESVRRLIRSGPMTPDPSPMACEQWPWPIRIRTFGHCTILIDDRPIQSSGKAQKKPLELLKALVALGGHQISEALLTEGLWPNTEADAAQAALKTTIYRLRKLLTREEAIIHHEGAVSLHPKLCWVDLWEFKSLVREAERIITAPRKNISERDHDLKRIHDRIMLLYQGHFLEQEIKLAWTISPREQFKKMFLSHLTRIGLHWESAQLWEEAIQCYNQGLEIDPLTETLYQQLINCYLQLDRRAEALAVYQRCSNFLMGIMGIAPSLKTETLYQKLFKTIPKRSGVAVFDRL